MNYDNAKNALMDILLKIPSNYREPSESYKLDTLFDTLRNDLTYLYNDNVLGEQQKQIIDETNKSIDNVTLFVIRGDEHQLQEYDRTLSGSVEEINFLYREINDLKLLLIEKVEDCVADCLRSIQQNYYVTVDKILNDIWSGFLKTYNAAIKNNVKIDKETFDELVKLVNTGKKYKDISSWCENLSISLNDIKNKNRAIQEFDLESVYKDYKKQSTRPIVDIQDKVWLKRRLMEQLNSLQTTKILDNDDKQNRFLLEEVINFVQSYRNSWEPDMLKEYQKIIFSDGDVKESLIKVERLMYKHLDIIQKELEAFAKTEYIVENKNNNRAAVFADAVSQVLDKRAKEERIKRNFNKKVNE